MSDVVVLRVQNPAALRLQPVVDLFKRAFEGDRFPDAHRAIEECEASLEDDRFALFVARREADLVGLSILLLSENAFSPPGGQVLHFYAPGDRDVLAGLVEAMGEFCRERGVKRVYTLNQSGVPDRKYLKLFGMVKGRRMCSFFEFDVPEETL